MAAGERVSGLLTLGMPGTVAAFSWAQFSTTALRGTILDPNGAVVSGAEVRRDLWASFLAWP
jgi:hypothetical protein